MPSFPSKFGAFGGHWSDKKLQVVQAYFKFYNQALSKTLFTRVYIDAFAGGGSVKPKEVNKKQVEVVEDYNWFAGDSSDSDDISTSEAWTDQNPRAYGMVHRCWHWKSIRVFTSSSSSNGIL